MASQFCDSAISWTGARGSFSLTPLLPAKGRNWVTLNFERIQHQRNFTPITQIGAVRQIDPIAACVDADTFLCRGRQFSRHPCV